MNRLMKNRRGPLNYTVPPARKDQPLITSASQIRPGVDPRPTTETNRTDMYTLFTEVGGTNLIYSAEQWVKITLRLETAGPVDVGMRQELTPVLSGQGTSLNADDLVFTLAKGNRLYYAAAAVNRVRVVIEPIPWLESILRSVDVGFADVVKSLRPMSIIRGLAQQIAPGLVAPMPDDEPRRPHVPCPPPLRPKGR